MSKDSQKLDDMAGDANMANDLHRGLTQRQAGPIRDPWQRTGAQKSRSMGHDADNGLLWPRE